MIGYRYAVKRKVKMIHNCLSGFLPLDMLKMTSFYTSPGNRAYF